MLLFSYLVCKHLILKLTHCNHCGLLANVFSILVVNILSAPFGHTMDAGSVVQLTKHFAHTLPMAPTGAEGFHMVTG